MEVRKDFGKRMVGLAESLPREVLAALLTRLTPVVPVNTRPPIEAQRATAEKAIGRDPFATRSAMRSRRRPKSFSREYKVLRPYGLSNHRRGTWTYAMVKAVLDHNDEDGPYRTSDAEAWLRQNHPEFDHKMIDWDWLANTREYITFNTGE